MAVRIAVASVEGTPSTPNFARIAVTADACVFAEEGLGEPTDPWFARLPVDELLVVPFGDMDVFLVVVDGAAAGAAIATLLDHIDSFFGFITVTRFSKANSWARLRAIDLDQLARAATLIAVPAYDAAGYVLWEALAPGLG